MSGTMVACSKDEDKSQPIVFGDKDWVVQLTLDKFADYARVCRAVTFYWPETYVELIKNKYQFINSPQHESLAA